MFAWLATRVFPENASHLLLDVVSYLVLPIGAVRRDPLERRLEPQAVFPTVLR